ncbi:MULTISPECIES: nucleoside recognition domain-containing protein [Chryseobacterium]|uniref:Spore maturation protein A n=1 Tax=Chryseobacterium indoltheticum TaxID=254 RepID=A0A381F6P2_9FLAO|nr:MULTISPECIES: spore maturation protein [Chryseobacterium]AZA72559.1 spore maturation protein [Chryseobacterium indoltheticum]MDQ8142397.1 nucleoside recognition domain-containing protein [Chryseobacterium sp. CFS15]SIQ75088.1 Spore maturation protein SpmA [Chryseobacterium indoltheticum]SUX42138.1 Spore maturation protein A [Chryseobacterium indoltheticum]SUX47232.1 Spore maturation protein A [Chryseobacterium indoltheticum]
MVLSRIWSAFIIIAITIASIKYISSSHYKTIFNDMVVGKGGDTVQIATQNMTTLSPIVRDSLKKKPDFADSRIHYKTDSLQQNVQVYRVQEADGVIGTSETAVKICLGLIGIMTLFMGFMSIAEKAGGINLLSRLIQPFFSKLFPEIPKNHPAFGHMLMNFSANLLGLDNAATPFGLKAMESLQTLNPNKDTASNSQIMFLCLHAGGMTLIPVSIIAIRASMGSKTPTDIFLPCMIATFAATLAAMIFVSLYQKINLLKPVVLAYVGGISALIALLVVYLVQLSKNELDDFSKVLSNGLILFIFIAIVLGAVYKKINVFDAFIEGAKEGFWTCVKIIPYLVGMLIAISLLRTSGVFDVIIDGMKWVANVANLDARFVDGLPTALIKPLSGSGARGMMVDTMATFGADSFQGKLAAVLQGSSDTTFYVIAVYFGAVAVKNTRYTVVAMLLADLVGVITAIGLAYLFFA